MVDDFGSILNSLPYNQSGGGVQLREDDIAVCNVKIDLTRGKDNPLER